MDNASIISFIAEEMLLISGDQDRVDFVTNVAKVAERDDQMFKYMQLWMKIIDHDRAAQEDLEFSMKSYLGRKV